MNIICYLADYFIQSDLQMIRLSRGQSLLEKCGVKGVAQQPDSCADLTVPASGPEPPTFRVEVLCPKCTLSDPCSVVVPLVRTYCASLWLKARAK